ncbi:MAG: hypothetical protein EPN82_10170 [Bacteroidetes bacterium]|nr:MAG: hypothetical protein EPN82_10170 [Bacteroidota bacterium]
MKSIKNSVIFIILIFCSLILFSGCSYYISRDGYSKTDIKDSCEVYIFKNFYFAEKLKKVGSVKLEESGLTMNCEMENAFSILKREACYANANMINITKEYFPDRSSSCYRCDADLYQDTNYSVIYKYRTYDHFKIVEESPFDYLPFNYVCFNFGIDYTSVNKNFWSDLLKQYNLPTEKAAFVLYRQSISFIYQEYYFDLNFGFFQAAFNNNDSLESDVLGLKFGIDFGYNVLNDVVTISPYLGLRYFYQNHTVSYNKDDLTLEQWMRHPDISLRANQFSGVIGINLIYPIYYTLLISGNAGYNFNFHKYPFLNSDEYIGINHNQSLIKNFYCSINFGYGFNIDKKY